MSSPNNKSLLHSFLLGPLRTLVPALLNVLLVPIMMPHGGISTVGIWGTLNLAVGLALLLDLGISRYLSKAISTQSLEVGEIRQIAEKAATLWFSIAAAATVIGLALAPWYLARYGIPLNALSMLCVGAIPLLGALAVLCLLLLYMHVAAHQVPYAQMNDMAAAVAQFVIAATLLQISPPYLALTVAFCARYLGRAILLYRNLHRAEFPPLPRRLRWPSLAFILGVVNRAKGFGFLGASLQLFLVVNRLTVLWLGGTQMLGLYEIASRIPFVLEQAFSNGLQALFAVFSSADWRTKEGRNHLHHLMQWLVPLLVIGSMGTLAAWIAASGSVIGLWLNIDNPNLVLATKLIGTLYAVRGMNILVFWALQSRGYEGNIAVIYAGQMVVFAATMAIMATQGTPSIVEVTAVIAATSLTAEALLIAMAQLRLGLFSIMVKALRDTWPLLCAAGLLAGAWLLASPAASRADAIKSGTIHVLGYALLWCAVLLFLGNGRPLSLLKPEARQASID